MTSRTILLQAPPTFKLAARQVKAQIWLPAVEANSRYPVLLYLPSWGGRRDDNSILATGLASHGYAVVAVDDVLFDEAYEADSPEADADRTAGFDFSSASAYDRTLQLMDRRVVREAGKASRVIDGLALLTASDRDSEIATKIDLTDIGVFGLSFGGSAAAEMPALDNRIAAAVNMDGWHFASSARDGVRGPYLMLNSIYPWPGPADLHASTPAVRYEARLTAHDLKGQEKQAAKNDSYSLFIGGASHSDFSDDLFLSPKRIFYSTSQEKLRIYTTVESYILSFFDRYLKHAPGTILATPPPDYWRVKNFTSMRRDSARTASEPTNPG